MSDSNLAACAAAQLGLVTDGQARAEMTRKQVQVRLETGRLERRHPGVIAMPGCPESWERALLAECLGHDAVASHRAAARVCSLPAIWTELLEVTVPAGDRRCGRARIHRSTIPRELLTTIGSIPVTTPARTIVDLAAVTSAERLARVLDGSMVQRRVTFEEVAQALALMRARGRRRISVIRALLKERALEPHLAETTAELQLFRWIVASALPIPVQQHWVIAGGTRYRLDLAYVDERISIESDGRGHVESFTDRRRDAVRDAAMAAAGWLVLRLPNDVDMADAIRLIRHALRDRQHPNRLLSVPKSA